jgi:protein Tex
MNQEQFIAQFVQALPKQISNTIELLNDSCTVPFIARYRKEKTGKLDEVAIENIAKYSNVFADLIKRKESVLQSIEEQNMLTPELKSKIEKCFDPTELEDLYLPYKKKKTTKGMIAKQKGLEPLAKILLEQNTRNIEEVASKYLNEAVENEEDALKGACDIVAEWINEDAELRQNLRKKYTRNAIIQSKKNKKCSEEDKLKKFGSYIDKSEPLHKCPSHRLLAMLRGETEGVLSINVEMEQEPILWEIEKKYIRSKNSCTPYIQASIKDSFSRLLNPALSNETLQHFKTLADNDAILVFGDNLSQLLLSPPLGQKNILALDPGFRTGCKLVCLNAQGDLLHHSTIYPHEPQNQKQEAGAQVKALCEKYKIEAIAIGNGTASRETEAFVKSIAFASAPQVFVVNESGASIYSASKTGREEFPDQDVTVRGAISIGRRLSDPLAELVKIEPKSIGVGQYQHDVNETKLKEELDNVVVRCVNKVGVNLNTASKHLLAYISGIGPKLAENIVQHRTENGPFKSRIDLKKVARLGPKAYEQAIAFLKVPESKNPLDNSFVHPESYDIVNKMAQSMGCKVTDLIANKQLLDQINPQVFVDEKVGLPTLQDILKELEKPGLDPRKQSQTFAFDPNLKTINDLREGMVVPGIVNNITNFGCFVDIGIKESGLVHISNLSKNFVSKVSDVVKIQQQVQVKVLSIDMQSKRIQLSMLV